MCVLYSVAPNDKMKDVLKRTVSEAKAAISKARVYLYMYVLYIHAVHVHVHVHVYSIVYEHVCVLSAQSQVDAGVCMSDDIIQDALDKLRGAVTIVYPMGLPPHDPIRLEFEGNEDLAGTQVYIP